jgi:predicted dienelactone hydrolase
MMIINLGEEETVPTGVYAKDAAARMGQATYTTLPEATHFSFLVECKPRGAARFEKRGELDPLCDGGSARTRADIHAELIRMFVSNLRNSL